MLEGTLAEPPLADPGPGKRSKTAGLLWGALGAVLWGVFFCVTPIYDLLVPGAVLWIPLGCWLEVRRARKDGFMPGFVLRLAIIVAMVTGAIYLPTKYEDRMIVHGLSASTVTLRELGRHAPISYAPKDADVTISLPSSQPTLRETMRAIETQTSLRCEAGRCGNGVTFLGGAYIMRVGIQ